MWPFEGTLKHVSWRAASKSNHCLTILFVARAHNNSILQHTLQDRPNRLNQSGYTINRSRWLVDSCDHPNIAMSLADLHERYGFPERRIIANGRDRNNVMTIWGSLEMHGTQISSRYRMIWWMYLTANNRRQILNTFRSIGMQVVEEHLLWYQSRSVEECQTRFHCLEVIQQSFSTQIGATRQTSTFHHSHDAGILSTTLL